MSSSVRYRLTKSLFMGDRTYGAEVVGVVAETDNGAISIMPQQSQGYARDTLNTHNKFNEITQYIHEKLPLIGLNKNMTPRQAAEKIDKMIAQPDASLDKRVKEDINAISFYHDKMRNIEAYKAVVFALRDFIPSGIHAMLTGTKYPLDAAAHDFLKGISHKKVLAEIEKLPKDLVKRLAKFCAANNFEITQNVARKEANTIQHEAIYEYPHSMLRESDIEKSIARAADDMLRDAAKYEYFKLTGNMDIFMTPAANYVLAQMSDQELARKYAPYAMQYFESALIIKQRIDDKIKNGEDITPLIKYMLKYARFDYAYYCNQNIIRMMYDTIKVKYNRFNRNDSVSEFMRLLLQMTTDGRLAKHIVETFGLDYDAEMTKERANKLRSAQALKKAAKRIADGEAISDSVVIDKIEKIRTKYGMSTGPDTFAKTKKTLKPSEKQMEIMKRFGDKSK